MKKVLQYLLRHLHFRNIDRIAKVDILRIIKRNNIKINNKVAGEHAYINKWKVFRRDVDVRYFRGYAYYIGGDENIVPSNILNSVLEPGLNDKRYSYYYSDKNVYGRLFSKEYLPATFLRKICGSFYDENYRSISNNILTDEMLLLSIRGAVKIVTKPTINTNSGEGVLVFMKKDEKQYLSQFGDTLSLSNLNKLYSDDFIIQEFLCQHEFTSQFNSSSVNTYRVATYRSVTTNEVHVLGIVLRVGRQGSSVDNIHAGGYIVGINERGLLNSFLTDADGQRITIWNGVDYERNRFVTPHLSLVLDFARHIASMIVHQRFLALDIMVDSTGHPKLIEYNIGKFSDWIFELNTGTIFGIHTDEVISFCRSQQNSIQYCFQY